MLLRPLRLVAQEDAGIASAAYLLLGQCYYQQKNYPAAVSGLQQLSQLE